MIVHVIGLIAGASATGVLGFVIGDTLRHPPQWILGALALALAAFGARLVSVKLEGSRWRVPGHWARLGHIGDSAAFGFMVGTGVATALASPGFYLVAAWGLAAPEFSAVWPVFAAFGAGRAAPFLTAGVRAFRRGNDVGVELDNLVGYTSRLGLAEAVLLTALAPILLMSQAF